MFFSLKIISILYNYVICRPIGYCYMIYGPSITNRAAAVCISRIILTDFFPLGQISTRAFINTYCRRKELNIQRSGKMKTQLIKCSQYLMLIMLLQLSSCNNQIRKVTEIARKLKQSQSSGRSSIKHILIMCIIT